MNSNANLLNETNSLNKICVLFNFWKLKTENSLLHIFTNWVLRIIIDFELSNKFFCFKNKKLFLETENKGKNSYQTYYLLKKNSIKEPLKNKSYF